MLKKMMSVLKVCSLSLQANGSKERKATNVKTKKRIGLISIVFLIFLSLFIGQFSVRADTTTSGGARQGVEVRETKRIHQNKYDDFATDLHIKLWQKEDNINVNGWDVEISGFTSSSSQRGDQPEPEHSKLDNLGGLPRTNDPDNGQHAVDVAAGGTSIPKCTWVTIKAKFWLTAWNAKHINWSWTREGQPEKKGGPNHGWEFDWPKPDPQSMSQYLHLFTITNDDTTDYLNVTGLAFNATMNWYDDLTQIAFPSPYPDFALAPGQSWSTNITTSSPMYGGHIYFKYAEQGSGIYSEEWADHPVTEPPTTGGIWIPVDKLGLLAPYIGLTSAIFVGTVATAVYVKRAKRRKEKR
jgi:hypothetical protein